MKTSIKIYKRKNNIVKLIGCCHIGTEEYYQILQKECEKSDNTIYEMVKGDKSKFKKYKNTIKMLLKLLNENSKSKLVFQKEGIRYKKSWINGDLNHEVLEALLGKKNYLPSFDQKDFKAIEKHKKIIKPFLKLSLKFLPIICKFLFKEKEIIINLRNSICLMKLAKILKINKNISILYGEAHINKFDKQLKEMGFREIKNKKVEPFKTNRTKEDKK